MSNPHRAVIACLLVGCVWISVSWAVEWPGRPLASVHPDAVTDEILVILAPGPQRSNAQVAQRFSAQGVGQARRLNAPTTHRLGRTYLLTLDAKADSAKSLQALAEAPEVEHAEYNLRFQIATTPNDTYYATQGTWGQAYDDLYGLKNIGLLPMGDGVSGWDYERGEGSSIVVAVIDTGVDNEHEDLVGRIWINPNEIPGTGVDDDGNGYIDDVWGWDFDAGHNNPFDDNGHGTHVAGTIGALTNNALGIAGIHWDVRIMALKGLNQSGFGSTDRLAEAIVYAADNGAHILNNSWGGSGVALILEDAMEYAVDQGCLVVAAAGNNDWDITENNVLPAHYPGVVAVSAIDHTDRRAWFTNFGQAVELAAPGVDILSLRAKDTDLATGGVNRVGEHYARLSGTSMACPHVVGAAALVWSASPGMTAEEVRAHLKHTADDIYTVNPDEVGLLGVGRINLFKALSMAEPAPNINLREVVVLDETVGANPNGKADPGEDFFLEIVLSNFWADAGVVSGELRSLDPRLVVHSAQASFGPLPEGGVARNDTQPFFCSLSDDTPLGANIPCELLLSSDIWSGTLTFDLPVAAPRIEVQRVDVQDWPTGNNNGLLEPGEEGALDIRLTNHKGAAAASALRGVLTSDDPYVEIVQDEVWYGTVPPNTVGVSQESFRIRLDAGMPREATPALRLTLLGALEFEQTITLRLFGPEVEHELSRNSFYDPWHELYFEGTTILADAQGAVHASWEDIMNQRWRFNYGRFSGGWWMFEHGLHPPRLAAYRWWPRLGVSPTGWVGMAYTEMKELPGSGGWDVYYNALASVRLGEWEPTTYLSDDPYRVYGIDSAMDDQGIYHVVYGTATWVESTVLLYHARHDGVRWLDTVHFATMHGEHRPFDDFRLRSRGAGRLWLVWPGRDNLRTLRQLEYNGAQWGTVSLLPLPVNYVGRFDVGVDSRDVRHVVLADYVTRERVYLHSGDNFTSKGILLPSTPRGMGPSLAIGPDDTVHIVYTNDNRLHYRTAVDGVLSAQQTPVTWVDRAYFHSAVCAVDTRNNVHITYQGRLPGDVFSKRHLILPGQPASARLLELH